MSTDPTTDPYALDNPEHVHTASHFKTAAIWYGWGRSDAGDYGVDAWQFADWYTLRVIAHLRGERSYRQSIQDAWAAYKGGER